MPIVNHLHNSNLEFLHKVNSEVETDYSKFSKKSKIRTTVNFFIRLILVILVSAIVIAGGLLLFLNAQVSAFNNKSYASLQKKESIFDIAKIITSPEKVELKGQATGRTNFLLIGEDYGGLSDSIQFVSYFWATNTVSFVNIPRDFKVNYLGKTVKINSIYNTALQNGGREFAEEELVDFLKTELNQPIDYWVKIKIDDLEKLVDKLGGVEVVVENSFTDCLYPNKDYSDYLRPCPSFEKGVQTLNGERALIYSRSRKSNNPAEANDFARSQRQSKVITALTEKLKYNLNLTNLQNISTANSILLLLSDLVKTNLSLTEIYSLYTYQQKSGLQLTSKSYNLSYGKDAILCDDAKSTLIPYCDGGMGGQSEDSKSRNKLRDIVQNLESQSE